MKVFSSILVLATFAASFVAAEPTRTTPLVARHNGGSTSQGSSSCSNEEFWYTKRSCCLTKGGPKTTQPAPSGVDCPDSWYFHHGQGCCVPRHEPTTSTTSTPKCTKTGWKWLDGLQCCSQETHTTTTVPHGGTSPTPKSKGYHKVKRNFDEQWDSSMCPTGLTSCQVKVGNQLINDTECLDTTSNNLSCGGCSSTDSKFDCSAIKNALTTSCYAGACVVEECSAGFKPSDDESSCVKA